MKAIYFPIAVLSPVQTVRVDAITFGLLASNVCIFIQLSFTSFSVTSLHCQWRHWHRCCLVESEAPFRPSASTRVDASNQTNVKYRKHSLSHRPRRCASTNLHTSNERCQFMIYVGYWTSNNNKWPKCCVRLHQTTPVLKFTMFVLIAVQTGDSPLSQRSAIAKVAIAIMPCNV